MSNIKRQFQVKVHAKNAMASITNYSTLKLLKSETLNSISEKDYAGRVDDKSLHLFNTYNVPAGNKLLAITFSIKPKKAFDTHGVKKFVMPRFSLHDKNSHGRLIGFVRNNYLDTNPRYDLDNDNAKWPSGAITAVFSVAK